MSCAQCSIAEDPWYQQSRADRASPSTTGHPLLLATLIEYPSYVMKVDMVEIYGRSCYPVHWSRSRRKSRSSGRTVVVLFQSSIIDCWHNNKILCCLVLLLQQCPQPRLPLPPHPPHHYFQMPEKIPLCWCFFLRPFPSWDRLC